MGSRHIVITGASSGIGRAIAKAFDQPGAKLSLVARRLPLLEELCAELRCASQPIVADLASMDDPVRWLREAEATFGATDVLVNNAGMSFVEPVENVDQRRIDLVFALNVRTPIAAIHHVLPSMLERGLGTIVNVASNAAFSPAPYFCHYTATKGALGNFSESLRMELKGRGVHVLSVYPGPIHTPMGDRNWAQLEGGESTKKLSPVGDPQTLALRVRRAVEKKRARVIYPRFYALSWYFPSLGRFVAEHLVPKATGEKTPPMPGDQLGD